VNLAEVIDGAVAAVPARAALIVGDRAIAFAEVGASVSRAAASLNAAGVRPGDRVALADRCGIAAIAAVLGAARLGAAAAPMSPALTAPELIALAGAAGCGRVGVAGEESRVALASALGAEPLGEETLLRAPAPARAPAPPHERAAAEVSGENVALVLFTGGTTGTPKPVPMGHGTLVRRVRSFAPPVDAAAEPPVAIVCVPFHHVAGLIGVLVGLAGGATAVVQPKFDAGEWLALVERHRVGRAFLVPAMLGRILAHPRFAATDLSSLTMITYGAAPAAPELIARAVEALPDAGFVNVFGQTETLGAVTALGPEEHRAGRAGSVGRLMPGVEARIVGPSGDDVRDGEAGELLVRAPHTASPGWVRTGDLVRRDPEGYLYPAGRLSETINRGGEKIDPAEVEAALRAHPAVAEAAVAGYPDAELGERVGAVVVLREDAGVAAVRSACRERLAAYKVPERIVVVEALPETELGKVSRKELRALLSRAPG
jgi:long-chain acyl-CoA synthetase